MLLRYAQHFAQGYGITWNIGEKPVEGATDFLFMVLIGALSRITHLGQIATDRILAGSAHVLSVVVLYLGARRLFGWPIWASIAIASYLALDISRAYIAAGFSPPALALSALLCWYVALRCIVSGPTVYRGVVIGLLMLTTALIRPDGLFMDMFIAAAMLFALRRAALPAIAGASAVLFSLGTVYFLWRWHYFGYLLPNPFYLKGGGHLYPNALDFSVRATCLMLAPTIPVFLVELFSSAWRRAVVGLLPPLGFTCIWVLLSNENNHFMRFQYCAVPIALLSLPYATTRLRHYFREAPGLTVTAQSLLIAVLVLFFQVYWDSYVPESSANEDYGLYNIAIGLSRFKDRDYVLATTEAGILPYFSEWRSVDLYGLNDATIVHSPVGLTTQYLEQRSPAVILVHQPPPGTVPAAFAHTVSATREFTLTHDYELAAEWSYSLCDRHLWFVKKNLPETQQFISIIRSSPYVISGHVMIDAHDIPVPAQCYQAPVRLTLSQ